MVELFTIAMPLSTGTRLGPYEIIAPLGAGGMGEVYRARDTRLSRDVALKVLPPEVAQDSARRQRFEQEARAAGGLNHPNIVAVYDIGATDGVLFIVSELVDGESLRALVRRGPLGVRKTIDIAVQVADGLADAHASAIVHRDLKPENIMVTREGRAKILDFGLAKQITPQAAGDATLTFAPTQPGMVMGTIGYMSPEQVRGQTVDARADIFSFGVILYEMLSGKRAFNGASAADAMSAILKEEPPELPATLPPALDRIVRHCIEKEPARRFQSAHDLAFGLRSLSGGITVSTQTATVQIAPLRRRLVALLAALGLLAAGTLVGALAGKSIWKTTPPAFAQLTYRRGMITGARFTPDGRSVVYSAAWDGAPNAIFSTRLDSSETLSMGLAGARLFSVSSSGEVAMARDARYLWHNSFYGTLARVAHSNEAPRVVLTEVAESEWAPHGDNLAVVHMVEGGQRLEYPIGKVLYQTAGWISYPRFSPQGDRIAFLDHPIKTDNMGSVAMVDLAGKKTTLTGSWRAAQGLAWSPQGDEIWFTAAESGPPKSIHGVTPSGRHRIVASFPHRVTLRDISLDGRVLLATEMRRSEMMGLAAREKKERDLGWLDNPVSRDLSGDGKMVLFHEQGYRAGGLYEVYVRKLDGSPAVRLGEGTSMSLSPDGKWALALVSTSPPQLVLLPMGEGEPTRFPKVGLNYQWGSSWFPDSRRIVFAANEPGHGSRLWVQDLDAAKPQAFTAEGVSATGNFLSPDGKVAAATGPDGRVALYPLDGGKPRALSMLAPGEQMIRWADNRQMYVYERDKLPARVFRVELESGKRTFVREFAPNDETGVFQISAILLTPDASAAAFRFTRVLSDLYVVEGLK